MNHRLTRLAAAAALSAVLVAIGSTPAAAGGAPKIRVTPSTNLETGDRVTIRGRNYTPRVTIAIIQCEEGAVDANGCDLSTLRTKTSTTEGSFATGFIVAEVISTPNSGEVQCGTAPGVCILAAANLNDLTEAAGVPLSFS